MKSSSHFARIVGALITASLAVSSITARAESAAQVQNDLDVQSVDFRKPDHAALLKDLDQAPYVVEGSLKSPKSVLYVFFDANCPFCHYTWKALQPYEKIGLQVRWLPVAILGPSSLPKAIEIMAAADKTAAFRKMEENSGRSPLARFSSSKNPDVAERIRRNGELMEKFGIRATPGIVWKEKSGKVNVMGGMPRLSDIPKMLGLPEQENHDPELARFR